MECLQTHEHSDECVASLTAYRDAIAELDALIESLTSRRDELQPRLDRGASRTFDDKETPVAEFTTLPADPARTRR